MPEIPDLMKLESKIYKECLTKYPNLLTIFLKNGKVMSVDYFYDKKEKRHTTKFKGFDEITGFSNGVFCLIPYILAIAQDKVEKYIKEKIQ